MEWNGITKNYSNNSKIYISNNNNNNSNNNNKTNNIDIGNETYHQQQQQQQLAYHGYSYTHILELDSNAELYDLDNTKRSGKRVL